MNTTLKGCHVTVGISGGIAAYKSPQLVRLLVKAEAEVQCVATANALQFVTPLTLSTLSKRKLNADLFAIPSEYSIEHIAIKDWTDIAVIAPATANCIGKLASGIADDALSTLLIALSKKPVFMCPAMNTQMWESAAVQHNINLLKSRGVHIIAPRKGNLACGADGDGRMAEPEEIIEHISNFIASHQLLAGRKILVTAGPTYEKIDAVRFIGNFSTGKMGFAVAEALAGMGAEVELVTGPTHLSTNSHTIKRTDVTSAQEMWDACMKLFPTCDAAILSAAVADYRVEHQAQNKIKKSNDTDGLTLQLVQNPDILASLGKIKEKNQLLVGFALETDNELANAKAKLQKKNLDFIVLNTLRDEGAGFGYDTNKVTIIDRDGKVEEGGLKSKQAVAQDIAMHLHSLLQGIE